MKQVSLPVMVCTVIVFIFNGMPQSRNYRIGPGMEYAAIGAVRWGTLMPGDSVLIHYRRDPYKEKWVICNAGTALDPIVISGVADDKGLLPIIDGRDAITDTQFNYWNEDRGIIKIGGCNKLKDTMPAYIIVQNLDICNGNDMYTFSGRNGVTPYNRNAAAVYIEKGRGIVLRNCVFHGCGNGLFSSNESANVTITGCYYYGNGKAGSIYEHNNYTESSGITFEFNRFGPLLQGAGGNNLKDRSSRCVIRYNWIEGGNRQLDLVESDYASLYQDTGYRKTFVYGNILVEPEGDGNSQIVHYGGDGGTTAQYRKGMLFLYHNTIVSLRTGNTTLLRLSTNDERADVRNNIYYCTANGEKCAIVDSDGRCVLSGNWIKTGWVKSHSNPGATVIDSLGTVSGTSPGFVDPSTGQFLLTNSSPCIDRAIHLHPYCLPQQAVLHLYRKHQGADFRTAAGAAPDIGAYEYSIIGIVPHTVQHHPSLSRISIRCRSNTLMIRIVPRTEQFPTLSLFTGNGRHIATLHTGGQTSGDRSFSIHSPHPLAESMPVVYSLKWHNGLSSTGVAFIQR